MSLAGYASKAIAMTDELRDGWTEEDFQSLRLSLRSLGFAEWEKWRTAQRSAVAAVVAATPQQRNAAVAGHPEPLLLKFAAMQFLAEAAGLLQAADRLQNRLGRPYREVASAAGQEHATLLEREPAYNPDDFLGPDWSHPWRLGLRALFEPD